MKPPMFAFGRLMTTPAAKDALQAAQLDPMVLVLRHVGGDWGELSEEDAARNNQAVEQGRAVFSIYTLPTGVEVCLVTEGDRELTTLSLLGEG